VPSLHSWRTAEFLYDIIARWGKPKWVRTDNGAEYQGCFAKLCKGLAIAHHHITVGNSKANGQAERTIRLIKQVCRKGVTADPQTFWSNHLPAALMRLRFTVHKAHQMPPFRVLTGQTPNLPSIVSHLEDGEMS